jgi:hypothetical protein
MQELTPLKPLGTIDQIFELDCVYDKETRQGHVDSAIARKLPLCIRRVPRKGKVAIVASGPSATDYVDLLKAWDGEIWGINGAFVWMMHRGTTCLGRAPNLAYLQGYREVHIFGCDSSFTNKSHVYGDHGEMPAGTFLAEMGDRKFITTRQMMQQACDFCEQMVEWARPGDDGSAPLSVSLYGDGLLQAMFSQTLESGSYQQYLRELYSKGMTRKQQRALRRAA